MSVFFAILLFSFLIFIHELGHFAAAKWAGVQVNEFSLFMGPAIFKKQVGETLYALRCIPFGGYCAMEGEDGGSDNPRSFEKAKWWKRLIILVAGALMNFIAGVAIFAVLYLPGNVIVEPVIVEFTDCAVCNHEAGLQAGDCILELDGEKIYVNGDVTMLLSLNNRLDHDVLVLRDGKELFFEDFRMGHMCHNEDGAEVVHYGFSIGQRREVGFFEKVAFVWDIVADNVRNVRLSLQMLFTGQAGIKDLTGPVGLVQIMSEAANESETTQLAVLNLLYFGGLIAVNLAVMNLLPIPALDGGRVLGLLISTAYEKVTGKKLNPKYEAYIHGFGMILLLALMGVILFKDIFVAFRG